MPAAIPPPITTEKKDWDRFWAREESLKFTQPSFSKRRIIEIISPFLPKCRNVLDAGCGTGFFSKYFCDSGLGVVSLDYSDSALGITKRMTQGRSRVVKEDLLSENLAERLGEKFDIIFSDGLFEHFSSAFQDRIIQNFLMLLKAEGIVITFVPNRFSPWELIRPWLMPGIEEKPFVLKGLIDLNERNGLSVVQRGGVNTIPFRLSPDQIFGRYFGMLLYTIARADSS